MSQIYLHPFVEIVCMHAPDATLRRTLSKSYSNFFPNPQAVSIV